MCEEYRVILARLINQEIEKLTAQIAARDEKKAQKALTKKQKAIAEDRARELAEKEFAEIMAIKPEAVVNENAETEKELEVLTLPANAGTA